MVEKTKESRNGSFNWVLTVVPVTMYGILVGRRMGKEEAVLEERFGQAYTAYRERTGRLLPRMRREE
jgi:protein-S-isoprenylcysteine O-methyltransferase Ste14